MYIQYMAYVIELFHGSEDFYDILVKTPRSLVGAFHFFRGLHWLHLHTQDYTAS
jgi:hypothetical protein